MFWRLRDLGVPSYIAVGSALLALVVADSVTAGVRSDGSSAATPPAVVHLASGTRGLLAGAKAVSVASGRGEIWALAGPSSHAVAGRVAEEIDPKTGRVLRSVPVPAPATYVFYGAHRVWVSGAGRVSAVNPSTGHVLTRSLGRGVAVQSMAFHGSRAYVADPGRDQIVTFTAGTQLRSKTVTELGGPRAVVELHGAIQPTNRVKNLVPVIFRGADTSFLAEVSRIRPVIASAAKRIVWVRRSDGLLRVTMSRAAARGVSVARRQEVMTGSRVRQLAMTPGGGCYVAIENHHDRRSHRNLLYFSRAALRARRPHPTSVHRGHEARDLALDPAGGVVYADRTGKLVSWLP
jgi:hypothetical protein